MIGKGLLILSLGLLLCSTATAADDPVEALRIGNDSYARGQYLLAIEEYRQVSPHSDRYAEAEYNIGVCYYELGNLEEALHHYAVAIKARDGKYVTAIFARGVTLEELGRFSEAKDSFSAAVEMSRGRHLGAVFKLGLAYQRARDYAAAGNLYRKALAGAGRPFPACHNNLGVVLALEGKYSEAEREFAAALQESKGTFEEARINIELCHVLMTTASRELLARLVSSGGVEPRPSAAR